MFYMNGYTIMIVDDESQMRDLVRTFLEAEQYQVVEATDGVHALDQINKTSPDLLIVDVMMPYMDGFHIRGRSKTQFIHSDLFSYRLKVKNGTK